MDEKFTLGFLVPETVFAIKGEYEFGISCQRGTAGRCESRNDDFPSKNESRELQKSEVF